MEAELARVKSKFVIFLRNREMPKMETSGSVEVSDKLTEAIGEGLPELISYGNSCVEE